jgi:ABC-type sugar transport system permease subunit
VVVGLVWRFLFESPTGLATSMFDRVGLIAPTWLADPVAAWVPLVLADMWKTTPFVALLLLAGLQGIDRSIYEAADVDGARPARQLIEITLPLLLPTMLVAVLFRALDAFRVFDLAYVLTGGGPGTATEPIALYAFTTFFGNLRFGFGAAVSIVIFTVAFAAALASIRMFGVTGAPGESA